MKQINREELIRQVREAGESLMKNAESIVGSEKFGIFDSLEVSIGFDIFDENPVITITRSFNPEMTVKRLSEVGNHE